MFVEKSSEEIAKMTEEAKASYIVEKNAHDLEESGKKYDAALEGKASKEDLEDLAKEIKGLKDARVDALEGALKAQGVEMTKFKEQIEKASEGKPVDFKAALLEGLNDNAEKLKGLKDNKSTVRLDIKANQDASDITSGTDFADMMPGVGQIATRQTFMRNLFNQRNTTKEYIKYNDQETILRDAKNVAGCASSTHDSKITWQVRTLQITKVRDFVDVCIDMMDDYEWVSGEIQDLVSTDVALKVDEGLLLGTDVYPELNSVDAVASTFAAGDYATSVQAPTLVDLIHVTACQISDAGENNKFTANYALVNPVSFCLLRVEKDANNRYLIPNFITDDGVNIGSVQVIANNLVPVNEMYVMDSTKGTVVSRRGTTVEFGFENNDNFEKEIVTVKAYERLNFLVRNVDANAFLHVPDIAAAITAITAP